MAAKMYYDDDADLGLLQGKKIAIIGYGIQGGAQAKCLRDSGLDVIVSELEGTPNYERAVAEGFTPVDAEEAARQAQIIQILTQDHVQATVYQRFIEPHLNEGDALVFSHGFNIHYGQIVPPAHVDVFMVAPKGPGALVRECYVADTGVPSLVAVYQDHTGAAMKLALAYAKAIKATKAGVIETTFAEETETDLFGEQAVLCGGVTALIEAGFDTLIKAGYKAEIAYFEVLHELKLIVDLIQAGGMMHMWDSVSNTAEYGGLTRRDKVINAESRKAMKQILEDINSGKFAEEWTKEWTVDLKHMKALEKEESEKQIEQVGREIRKLFERS